MTLTVTLINATLGAVVTDIDLANVDDDTCAEPRQSNPLPL